MGRADQ
jgi:cytochrome b involved in lipid metabolism